MYIEYSLIKDGETIYFDYEAENRAISSRKFEVKFDQKTKVLTVVMPKNMHTGGALADELSEFKFKRLKHNG